VTTIVEAARAAGFKVDDEGNLNGPFAGAPEDKKPAPQAAQKDRPEEPKDDIGRASAIIKQANAEHGEDVIYGHVVDAAMSGVLPEVGNLPEGVTAEQVSTVHAGYIAQAERDLAEVGSSIVQLQELMSGEDLRAARLATISGDNAKVRQIGEAARARFEAMPEKNEARWKELVATLPADQREWFSKDAALGWTVNLPAPHGRMPVAQAIRRGFIKWDGK
jgi:hypothetical protein